MILLWSVLFGGLTQQVLCSESSKRTLFWKHREGSRSFHPELITVGGRLSHEISPRGSASLFNTVPADPGPVKHTLPPAPGRKTAASDKETDLICVLGNSRSA